MQQSPTVKDQGPVPDPGKKLVNVIEREGFIVSLEVCNRSGSTTYCKFSIENNFNNRAFDIVSLPDAPIQVAINRTRAMDEFGNMYPAQKAGIGTEEGHQPIADIPSGTLVSAWVVFRDVAPDAKIFTRLDLFSFYHDYFQFGDIPLSKAINR
jgi:hypothetical protein